MAHLLLPQDHKGPPVFIIDHRHGGGGGGLSKLRSTVKSSVWSSAGGALVGRRLRDPSTSRSDDQWFDRDSRFRVFICACRIVAQVPSTRARARTPFSPDTVMAGTSRLRAPVARLAAAARTSPLSRSSRSAAQAAQVRRRHHPRPHPAAPPTPTHPTPPPHSAPLPPHRPNPLLPALRARLCRRAAERENSGWLAGRARGGCELDRQNRRCVALCLCRRRRRRRRRPLDPTSKHLSLQGYASPAALLDDGDLLLCKGYEEEDGTYVRRARPGSARCAHLPTLPTLPTPTPPTPPPPSTPTPPTPTPTPPPQLTKCRGPVQMTLWRRLKETSSRRRRRRTGGAKGAGYFEARLGRDAGGGIGVCAASSLARSLARECVVVAAWFVRESRV